jgi:N-acetylglucosamine kinase-like BadF-type ATPase
MLLIADSGSTKCDWILYNTGKQKPLRITTKGLNPSILDKKRFSKIIENTPDFYTYKNEVTSVYFFGAGCATKKSQAKAEKLISTFFVNAKVTAREDIMAAVWATTCEPAVVCILGTGSNCCYFDGNKTHSRTPSLGYMVMDEGSGNYFGKELLKGYYYKQMPEDLRTKFESTYNLNEKKVTNKLYRSSTPNKYLAEFAHFLFENKRHPYISKLIKDGINKFIENHVLQFREELNSAPIHFVGSIAYYSMDFINTALLEKGIRVSSFVKRPIENLINHLEEDHFQIELS